MGGQAERGRYAITHLRGPSRSFTMRLNMGPGIACYFQLSPMSSMALRGASLWISNVFQILLFEHKEKNQMCFSLRPPSHLFHPFLPRFLSTLVPEESYLLLPSWQGRIAFQRVQSLKAEQTSCFLWPGTAIPGASSCRWCLCCDQCCSSTREGREPCPEGCHVHPCIHCPGVCFRKGS